MIKAKGNGQSECYQCKQWGWTDFLYKIEQDNYEHLYCYKCAKQLEELNNVNK